MLRPYKSFLARHCVIEGPDRRRRTHRRSTAHAARAGATRRRGHPSHPRVHRVRAGDHRAPALRARCRRRGAGGATARARERRARNPPALEAHLSLPRHRGPAMVAPARTALRADRLRAVNVPQPVAVELNAGGEPTLFRRSRDNGGGQETKAAVVEAILESWRVDDEWWRQLISRRYFEVALEGGGRVVLFEDRVSGEWFVQTA